MEQDSVEYHLAEAMVWATAEATVRSSLHRPAIHSETHMEATMADSNTSQNN